MALATVSRAELEFDYRGNSFDSINGVSQRTGAVLTTPGVNGSEQLYGPMVSILYDFNGLSSWVIPYAGVGVGYQRGHGQLFRRRNRTGSTGVCIRHHQSSLRVPGHSRRRLPDTVAAGPVPHGRLSDHGAGRDPHLQWGGDGHAAVRRESDRGRHDGVGAGRQQHLHVRHPLQLWRRATATTGRTRAGSGAAPARSYLVFFDWDKATLTDRARQIISEAATNSTKVQDTRIEVNGYTDTSGTPRYNQGLSIRRARAVQAELVKDGVPQNAITIQGFGDTNLLVPTGPGVREPQNRRVEIIIR